VSRLLLAELNRLRSRRFTILGLLVVALLLGAFQLQVNSAVAPPSAAAATARRANFEQARQDWQNHHREWEQECLDSGQPADQCTIGPPAEADFGLVPATFREVAARSVQTAGFLTALVAFLISASYIGAEYTSGAIATWLSFVPRRGRVFASKLTVVAAFAVALSAVAGLAMLLAAAVLVAIYGGTVSGLGGLTAQVARAAAGTLILAVLGFCIAMLGRHTSAALGLLLGYLLVAFVRLAVLHEVGWAQRLSRWTPEGNLLAIVQRGFVYQVPVRTLTPEGMNVGYVERTIGFGAGVGYWAMLLAVLVALSWLVFSRRDVT